ncbi:carbohydrate ABC transporter ATP-binding protein (CUT1 family) [Luteibacter rhizovicinus]|uniref:Carbohydrate ABC transporter ATP-binding protein (CUT1 family) n=1 Tax=Luteibacter rhizovicinus TaxID=242606 RepID=A0A4V2W4J9_9GAMM|nr:sn-glycerol-3-phosphate ABC transporter ATP-binding protein UgpC [Luteibacter rhizovicinus]TCV96199.1 carbohydrate ABC transporter ATP-binding protein (CUT1 family) [Luteibacter rhizovicinus]
MAGVRLDKVRKVYPNGHVAVAEASFDIADGELLVLVGPSGCGKTTLLRMIAGLESISGGELWIGDRVVNDVAPKDRDIAMVFQNYALYPHMTVQENLGFGLRLRGQPKEEIDRRVAEASDMLGLNERLSSKPAALSGGQRQRVALGRAMVRDPAVFLLDEPLSNLDAKLRLSTRVEIARIHRRVGATMIYVTHDQIEAMTLGQRIVVLNGGVIQQLDTPMNLYNKPVNLFVAGFLGSPAMNLFHGTLRRADGLSLQMAEGTVSLGVTSDALAAYVDKPVIVGVRPEDLQLAEANGVATRLHAHLEVVEPVGNEIFLNMRYAGGEIVSRAPPHSVVQPGTDVALGFAAERLHFFDPETTCRIDI